MLFHHAAAPAVYCCLIIAATALQLVWRAILQLETAVLGNNICLAEVFGVGGEVYPFLLRCLLRPHRCLWLHKVLCRKVRGDEVCQAGLHPHVWWSADRRDLAYSSKCLEMRKRVTELPREKLGRRKQPVPSAVHSGCGNTEGKSGETR